MLHASSLPRLKSAAATCLAAALLAGPAGPSGAEPPRTLQDAYGGKFALGAAIPPELTAAEQQLLRANFTNVTSENCLKPAATEAVEGRFTFEQGDALVALAGKLGLRVNGHTLVWHSHCPDWYFKDGDAPAGHDLVLRRLRAHIAAVVGRYRGRIASWDVVNEALASGDASRGDFRDTPWHAALGDDLVAEAFRAAQRADPDAELYYNDYGIEQPAKRARALRLIHDLKARGVRIDGIGIQGHWSVGKVPLQEIEDSVRAFHDAGVKVMVTELDLDVLPRQGSGADAGQTEQGHDDPYAAGCPPEVLARQAADYAALFRLFRRNANAISRVTFWNLHDGRSWLNEWPRKRTNHSLLWDRRLQPKPAFFAVLDAAAELRPPTGRPPVGR